MRKKVVLIILLLLISSLSFFFLVWILHWRPTESSKWRYYGRAVSTDMITDMSGKVGNVKDPEFVRLLNHTLFRDNDGYYYVVLTASTYMGVFKTKDLLNYTYVGLIDLNGKVAPYCIYDPDEKIFYLFYTDWRNTVTTDIVYGRLGLAVGKDIRNISSFEDKGYLEVRGNPLPDTSAGWDPYIAKVTGIFYMIFSAASHGVHIASSQFLGKTWTYLWRIIDEKMENPTLFLHESEWYMMLGIYEAKKGYDLYSSNSFLNWTLVKEDWFTDPENPVLPAGSTSALVNGTLYHLYQVPLSDDLIGGPFQLNIASMNVTEDTKVLTYSP